VSSTTRDGHLLRSPSAGFASYGAPGRVPPRLTTSYFQGIMRFLFAQILTVTRLEQLTLCSVECDLVQAADIDKIVDRFSAFSEN